MGAHCMLSAMLQSLPNMTIKCLPAVFLHRRRLLSAPDFFLISDSPILHGLNNRPHGVSQLTQGVFYPGRDLRIHRPGDDAVLLQGAQAVGEDLLADPRKVLLQFVEAPWARQQVPQDQQLPFAPDQLYGGGDGTGRVKGLQKGDRVIKKCVLERGNFPRYT